MSKYTTEVRYICEHFSGLSESVGYDDVEQVIKNCLPKVFDFNFPIFDESYRTVLETKILRHYYTREIGLDTVGLWKLKLNTKLNEIMPYYNQRYESCLLKVTDEDGNPLFNGKTVSKIVRQLKIDRANVVAGHDVHGTTSTSKNSANIKDTTSHSTNGWSNSTNTDNTTEGGSDNLARTGTDGTVERASESRDITSTRTDDLNEQSTNGNVVKNYDVPITGSNNGFSDTYVTNGRAENGTGSRTNTGTQTTHETASANGNTRDSNSTTTHNTVDTTTYGRTSNSEGSIDMKHGDTESSSSSSDSNGQNDLTSNTDIKTDTTTTDRGTDDETTTTTTTVTTEPLFELLMKYRDSFINVDMEVVNDPEISSCFMGLH